MNILLFGNKGQIGREIEEQCKNKNINIIGYDIDSADIVKIDQVEHAFKQNPGIDFVINTAAYTNVEKAEDEPEKAYQINCKGVQNLSLTCRQYDIPLIHLSTDYIFSGEKIGPYFETDTAIPLNIYGKSKLAGEEILKETWPKHIILRTSWVFGNHGNNFVKKILQLAHERDVLNVVDDQFGCPTAASDIARVVLEIAEKISQNQPIWGIYNYCNSPATTWHDFALKIIELGNNKFPLKVKQINKTTTEYFGAKAMRPKNSELLVMKINKDYGILRKNWEDYLAEAIDFSRQA